MNDTTLTQRFALLAIDGLPIIHSNALKKERIRAILTACFFDLYLNGHFSSDDQNCYQLVPFVSESPTVVSFTAHYQNKRLSLAQWVFLIASANRRILTDFENAVTIELISQHLLDEVNDISECDLLHRPQDSVCPEYRSDNAAFHYEKKQLRTLLATAAASPVPAETLTLLWLLEQSFLLDLLFSDAEQVELHAKCLDWFRQSEYAKDLFSLALDHSAYTRSQRHAMLRELFLETRSGSFLADLFPSLQPRNTVFIPSGKYYKTPQLRLEFALLHLEKKGHNCNILKFGDNPIIEVDNKAYELIARTVPYEESQIHGIQLLPVACV